MLFLILLLSVFNFKHWKEILPLLLVLITSYFLAFVFATFSEIKLNNTNIKFLTLIIILSLAFIKAFDFNNRYLKFKKEHLILVLTGLFGFFNGVGSSVDFIPEVGIFDYEIILILEVLFGFTASILLLFLTILSINSIFQKFVNVDALKFNTGVSVVCTCVTLCIIAKQILY